MPAPKKVNFGKFPAPVKHSFLRPEKQFFSSPRETVVEKLSASSFNKKRAVVPLQCPIERGTGFKTGSMIFEIFHLDMKWKSI